MPPEPGELVSSGGFRVDRSRALEKLAAFQLADGHQAILALIRCAVASRATRVVIETKRVKRVAFDGAPLSAAELEDPFAALFGEESGPAETRARQLAIGLLGLLGVSRDKVSVTGGLGAGRKLLHIASPAQWEGPVGVEGRPEVTEILFTGTLVDRARLSRDCWACPIGIQLDDGEIDRSKAPDRPGEYFEEDGRYGWVTVPPAPYGGSWLGFHVLGARVADGAWPAGPIPVGGYVNDDAFTLDAGQGNVVLNERFNETGGIVRRAAERLAASTARRLVEELPETARLTVSPLFATIWREASLKPDRPLKEGLLARSYLAAMRLLGADLASFAAARERLIDHADACRWLRNAALNGYAREAKLRAAPLFVTTDGGCAGLDDFERWREQGVKVRGFKGLFRGEERGSVWCSTPAERADLEALATGNVEVR